MTILNNADLTPFNIIISRIPHWLQGEIKQYSIHIYFQIP